MKKIYFGILILLALTGCEKEITLDYHSVDEIPVIEAYLTQDSSRVLITHTREMSDSALVKGIDGAFVTITSEQGESDTLSYRSDGCYYGNMKGVPGVNYTISVAWDGTTYQAQSTMQKTPRFTSFHFEWQEMLGIRFLVGVLTMQDIPDEENNFYCHIYRNGESYSWTLIEDMGCENREIITDLGFMSEEEAEDNKEEDWDEILYEGDEIRIEIQSIDKNVFDYLFSVYISESTSNNAIPFFDNNCLGFFSAGGAVSYSTTFRYADIVEQE